MLTHPYTTRVEHEFYPRWMEENPELFTKSVLKFKKEYPIEEWLHSISFHTFTVKLIATKRDKPFNVEKDYLKEVGH